MARDRRTHPEGATLRLGRPREAPVVADVERITVRGARLSLPLPDAPAIGVGQPAQIQITDPTAQTEVFLPAQIVSRQDTPERRLYSLIFTTDAVDRLDPELLAHLDRRGAFRAVPDPIRPVRATLIPPVTSGVPPFTSPLVDLSDTGLGVDVTTGFEAEMARFGTVRVRLALPGAKPVDLAAQIRRRSFREAGRVRYGLVFTHTEESQAALDQIAAWTARRQKEARAA